MLNEEPEVIIQKVSRDEAKREVRKGTSTTRDIPRRSA